MNNNHGGPRKGAGRPATGRPWRKVVSITLDPAILARAQRAADAAGVSLSAYIERTLAMQTTTTELLAAYAAYKAAESARPFDFGAGEPVMTVEEWAGMLISVDGTAAAALANLKATMQSPRYGGASEVNRDVAILLAKAAAQE